MKSCLSDNLTSDSEDKKQLSGARKEAAVNKKKRDASTQNDKKKQFWNALLTEKILKSIANQTKDTVAIGITQTFTKSVLLADNRGTFNISAQTEETDTTINSNKDCEISGKIESILVCGRLKEENKYFWKNELKLSLFV